MSRVTIADVASAAGVSKTAVSFAFNNPKRLGHATLERVLGVAEDLGYMPHPAARALSMRRSGTIGLLIPQRLSTVFANPFVSKGRIVSRPYADFAIASLAISRQAFMSSMGFIGLASYSSDSAPSAGHAHPAGVFLGCRTAPHRSSA